MGQLQATSLGQMPHGRWRTLAGEGGSSGIAESESVPWTAQILERDDGPQLGFTTFRLTDKVHEGTGEELALSLVGMLTGARTTRRQSGTGVISHEVLSSKRTDTRSMLASVGLYVTTTNPIVTAPAQTFVTAGDAMATARCHRDVWDAAPWMLRGLTARGDSTRNPNNELANRTFDTTGGRVPAGDVLSVDGAIRHVLHRTSAPYVLSAEHVGPAARSLRFALLELEPPGGLRALSSVRRANVQCTIAK